MTRQETHCDGQDVPRITMICDFLQIQGGQQISYFIRNLRASLNLLEKPNSQKVMTFIIDTCTVRGVIGGNN